ncbi:Pollen receptor-like kinase 1 [Hibiscus syriacus]|uniref:Pollen receptor-like kinase 1 n=2 Tax=Hibiscus syriacus TaxID=106335 RepID=A0A6A3CPK9_HIBSY|nr:Pollen receptor-like kinase 1 [Hibiscus syriacus]
MINWRKRQQPGPKVEVSPPSNPKTKTGLKVQDRAIAATPSPRSSNGMKLAESATKLTFLRDDDRDKFNLPDLLRASAEVLGSGYFGSSYRTELPNGSAMVVKRYKQMTNAGKEDFQEHMRRMGRLKHENVLTLVAYHYRKDEKLIVCDFVKNGSLAVHLHGHQTLGQQGLDWPTRLNIVKGIAKGLAYLYKELPSLVAPHGHLKSSNVLLNESFEPLLTDYGLIPVIDPENAQAFMTAYKSPEFVHHGRVTKKTDVWGLGVLILEIMTGKFPSNFLQMGKGSGEEDLTTWVKSIVGDDEETSSIDMEAFDKEMGAVSDRDGKTMLQLLKIGLSCCEDDALKRLDLKEAVNRIDRLKLGNISSDEESYQQYWSSSGSDEDNK